jgi:hypothetical protein
VNPGSRLEPDHVAARPDDLLAGQADDYTKKANIWLVTVHNYR